jgi:molybdopterin/thiamine biosynthesis adenylyltransferase
MASTSDTARIELGFEDEHDRYHRQSLISWWDQDRLRSATVIVVGAGALGNELVKNLALVGVGRVVVVDLDRVEQSNLARCVFFRPEDEGRPKAAALARRAAEVNQDVDFLALDGDVRTTVGLGLFAEADVVLGGLDNREARLFVNQACWKAGTPWVDGAIEGLMGVVRVFVPPDSSCYECTMSERDHELIAARRTCALLTRDDMLSGKVPTTATSASVVAGMQVQEAIKLLHRDRLGEPALAGAGFQFVGLTHDSYVVRYPRREECLSHDTYTLDDAPRLPYDTPLGAVLERAQATLGPDAILELEQDIVLSATCAACDATEPVLRPVAEMTRGAGLCPTCGLERRLDFAHAVEPGSALARRSMRDLGLPPADVVVGRSGMERCFFVLTDAASAFDRPRSTP